MRKWLVVCFIALLSFVDSIQRHRTLGIGLRHMTFPWPNHQKMFFHATKSAHLRGISKTHKGWRFVVEGLVPVNLFGPANHSSSRATDKLEKLCRKRATKQANGNNIVGCPRLCNFGLVEPLIALGHCFVFGGGSTGTFCHAPFLDAVLAKIYGK